MDLAEFKNEWIGRAFDHSDFTIDADDMVAWAELCGETDPRFRDPAHPDFQTHPGFTCHLVARKVLPTEFASLGNGRSVDGGKKVEALAPIRAGEVLTATSEIADIYEKTGRSGTMVFIIHRMTYTNKAGEPVSIVDWRMIRTIGS